MFREHLNKRNLTLALFALLAVLVVVWIFFPKTARNAAHRVPVVGDYVAEGFGAEEQVAVEDKNATYVDASTGTLMDGPGFEKGEVEGVASSTREGVRSDYYLLEDGADNQLSVMNNLCSPSCCSADFPTPFKQKYDPYVCNNKDDYVGTNIFCSNSYTDRGCSCVSKKQAQHIANRGMKTREFL